MTGLAHRTLESGSKLKVWLLPYELRHWQIAINDILLLLLFPANVKDFNTSGHTAGIQSCLVTECMCVEYPKRKTF